jgi:hypothetical protein
MTAIQCAACGGVCDCGEPQIDLLFVSPDSFRAAPQIGMPTTMGWDALAAYLSRPSVGDAKDVAGAYSPALYINGIRRKASLVRIWALIVDLDEAGDVDVVADAVTRYRAIVHETFSSTDDAARCRLVLALSEPVDSTTYEGS